MVLSIVVLLPPLFALLSLGSLRTHHPSSAWVGFRGGGPQPSTRTAALSLTPFCHAASALNLINKPHGEKHLC